MKRIEVHYPRWLTIPTAVFAMAFVIFWIYTALQSGNIPFVIMGAFAGLLMIAQSIYVVVTGKAPFTLRPK